MDLKPSYVEGLPQPTILIPLYVSDWCGHGVVSHSLTFLLIPGQGICLIPGQGSKLMPFCFLFSIKDKKNQMQYRLYEYLWYFIEGEIFSCYFTLAWARACWRCTVLKPYSQVLIIGVKAFFISKTNHKPV